jgi:hypothetical protein
MLWWWCSAVEVFGFVAVLGSHGERVIGGAFLLWWKPRRWIWVSLLYGGLAGYLWFGFLSFVIVWNSGAGGMWLMS